MSGKQRAVLWLGLIIIALNLVSKWSEIKGVIFKAPASNGSSGSSNSGSLPGIGGLQFPFNLDPGAFLGNVQQTPGTNQAVTPV